jgi:hypothetical protein
MTRSVRLESLLRWAEPLNLKNSTPLTHLHLFQKKAQFYQNSLIKAQAQHTEMERKLEEAVRDKDRSAQEHADAITALSRQLAEEKEARSSAEGRMRRYKTERNEARERLKGGGGGGA